MIQTGIIYKEFVLLKTNLQYLQTNADISLHDEQKQSTKEPARQSHDKHIISHKKRKWIFQNCFLSQTETLTHFMKSNLKLFVIAQLLTY